MGARTTPIRWTKGRLSSIDCGVRVLADFRGTSGSGGSPAATSGRAFHSAVEELLLLHKAGEEVPQDPMGLLDAVLASLREEGDPLPGTYEAPLRSMWRRFAARVELPAPEDILGIESPFVLDSSGDPLPGASEEDLLGIVRDHSVEGKTRAVEVLDVAFAGIFDLLFTEGSTLVVLDWKSGFRIPPEAELRTDPGTTLYAYAAAAAVGWAGDVVVRYVFPRYEGRGAKSARWGGVVRDVRLGPDEVADGFFSWLLTVRAREELPESDPYWSEPSAIPGCRYCGMRDSCGVFSGAEEGSPAAVVELGRQKSAAEKVLRAQAKDAPVEADGVVAHYVPRESSVFDAGRVIAVLDELGIDPLPYLSVSGKEARGLRRDALDALREAGAVERKTTTRFVVETPKKAKK